MKIVKTFRLKIVIFTALKNRCMLHGRVFVMFLGTEYTFFTNFQFKPLAVAGKCLTWSKFRRHVFSRRSPDVQNLNT